jgi:large subunit ribosomal protein L10
MDRNAKKESLKFLVDKLSDLKFAVIFTNFKGLSAQGMYDMRKAIKDNGGEYKVIKNTLALMAIARSGHGQAKDFISGPCGIAFSSEEPIKLVKALVSFSKENESFVLKGGILEGEIIDDGKLKTIAALPPEEQLLAGIAMNLNAPISNTVNYLHQMVSSLVCVINLIKSKPASDAGTQDEGG